MTARTIIRDPRIWWAAISVVWLVVLDRRTGGLSDFTTPHIGHIVVLPVAVYKLSWTVFGDCTDWPLLAGWRFAGDSDPTQCSIQLAVRGNARVCG